MSSARRDLDVLDVVAVPHRLEDVVGETQRHEVLHGLLAQVVIDAEHLRLREDREHVAVERARLLQVAAERLLDDDAGRARLVADEPVLAELAHDDAEELRRGREVEAARERLPGLLVANRASSTPSDSYRRWSSKLPST